MVVVNFAPESVSQFLASIEQEFIDRATTYLDRRNARERATVFTENAQQSVVLTGSYILAGYTGLIACMDIYNASPFSVQHMAVLKLALEPVVRVNISPRLFH